MRDIFNESSFSQVFSGFIGISTDTISPFIGVEFIDDGQRVRVAYLDLQFEELSAVFDLYGDNY